MVKKLVSIMNTMDFDKTLKYIEHEVDIDKTMEIAYTIEQRDTTIEFIKFQIEIGMVFDEASDINCVSALLKLNKC
jgi:hypothetical protein